MPDLIYLDHHATTPLDPRVLEEMLPFLQGLSANPASAHVAGHRARAAVGRARELVAALVGASSGEVVLTGSATEANNLALRGFASGTARRRIVSTTIEHPAVLEPLRRLGEEGFDIVLLSVDRDGRVDPEELDDALDTGTLLVSIAAANGEVGSIENLTSLVGLAHTHGALFHTDASQAAGKVPLDVRDSGIDMLTMSAHKLHGPQGIGALIVRSDLRPRLRPQTLGGGQESGARSGTANVAGAVGFGVAAALCIDEMATQSSRIERLRARLHRRLGDHLGDVLLNGPSEGRLAHNLNVRLPGVEAEALIATCPGVAFSAGSACSSGSPAPSHVLVGIGLSDDAANESVRFGLGRFTTESEVNQAADLVASVARRLRSIHDEQRAAPRASP